jgi:DNA invertase Pin-like site-specific DNA recombinase
MILSYARVSTEAQAAEDATSIGEQQRKIMAVAQLRGVTHLDVQTYVDPGVSGSVPLKERPAGARMLEEARKGDIIIATKLDRLFRSASDALVTVERLQEQGVHVILVDMGIDPVTANGPAKLFFTMLSAFAEFERGRILERMGDGRKAKVRVRGHIGGDAPYGWRVVGRGRGAALEPVEAEQDVIRRVFDLGQKFSPAGIVRALNLELIPTRKGKPWTIMQVCRIMDRQLRLQRLGKTDEVHYG